MVKFQKEYIVMNKKILSFALALILLLALVPAAMASETGGNPVFLDSIKLEVPGIPGMKIDMFNVYENYFYRESDGAVMFALGFPALFADGARIDYSGDAGNAAVQYISLVFDRDMTLNYAAKLDLWGPDFDFSGGQEIYAPRDLTAKAGVPFGTYVDGNADSWLDHSFTVDGVTVYLCQAAWIPPNIFINGEYSGRVGLIEQWTDQGFEMRPISSIATDSIPPAPDVPSSWAVPEVNAAIEANLVPESMQINYQGEVTRQAVATMFVNLIQEASGMPIDDFMAEKGLEIDHGALVDTDDPMVLAANALGIIRGKGGGVFDPGGTLLRSEITVMICRAAHIMGVETDGYTHAFRDVAGHWVEAEIGWPVQMNIIRGVSPTEFNPNGYLTTEQAIAITYRALEALVNPPEPMRISISDPLAAGRKFPILMYHAIADVPTTSLTDLFVRPAELEAQLQYIVNNGYQTITFEDLNNIGAFTKPIMLTFDDGYKDNFDILFPLLKKYNLKATIFVISDTVWSRNYISIENIAEMSASGYVSIQSHTKTHPMLTSLGWNSLVNELSESKAFIESITGKPVTALCYPSGSVNATVRAAVAEHYSYAVLNTGGIFTCGSNTLMMNRVRIGRGLNIGTFASLIT